MNITKHTAFSIRQALAVNRECGHLNVAVVPCGAVEQHGPLLPLATDTVLACAVAEALDAREEYRWFIHPPLWYSNADSGMDFAGTISVRHDTFRALVRDITLAVMRQGYDALLFLDGHATNKPDLQEIAYDAVRQSFRDQQPFPIIVYGIYDCYDDLCRKYQLDHGRHADWFEGMLFRGVGGELPVSETDPPDPYPDKKTVPPGIAGIPLGIRSERGVLGRLADTRETESLRKLVWEDCLTHVHQTVKEALHQWNSQFSTKKERAEHGDRDL